MPPSSDKYPLAGRIRQRYIQAPGVIRWSNSSTGPARAAEFAAGRLPLLTDVRRRWQPSIRGRNSARPSWVHPRPVTGDAPRPPIVSARQIPPVTRNSAGPSSVLRAQTKAAGVMRPGTAQLTPSAKAAAQGPAMEAGMPPTPAHPIAQEAWPSRPGAEPQIRPAIQPVVVDRKAGRPGDQPFSATSRPDAVRSGRLETAASRASNMAAVPPISRTHDRLAGRVSGRKTLARSASSPAPARPSESNAEPLRAAAPAKPVEIPSKPLIPLHRAHSPLKSGKMTVQHPVDPSVQGRRLSGAMHSRPPVSRQAAAETARPAPARAQPFIQRKTAAPGPVGKPGSPARRPASAADVTVSLTAADRDGIARSAAADGAVRTVRQSAASTAARPRDPADRNAFGGLKISGSVHPAAIARHSGGHAAPVRADRPPSPDGEAAPVAKPLFSGGRTAPVISSPADGPDARPAGYRPGGEFSVISAAQAASEGSSVIRQAVQRSSSNLLVTQAVKPAAEGPLVSRKAVQQTGSNMLVTQAVTPPAAASSSAPQSAALNRQPPTAAGRHDPFAGDAVRSAHGSDGRQPTGLVPRHPIPAAVLAAPSLLSKPAHGPWRFTREFSRRPYLQRDSGSRVAPALKSGARHPSSAMQPSAVSRPDTDRRPPPPASTRVFLAPAADSWTTSAAPAAEPGNGPAAAGAESPAPATSAGGEPIDLEGLADEVYDIIERRLIVERERSGM